MEAVTEYIKRNSNGRKQPIRGSTIASAFGVSGVRVRNMVNSARCKGDPICSNGNGYYIARDKSEIENTIASMKGRISVMNNNNIILNILGYEAIDTTYTDYDAPVDAPQDLFADEN